MPKVGIILSTYNRPEMLRSMVDSVAAQDWKDWRLYLCDDASDNERQLTYLDELSNQGLATVIRNTANWGNVTRGRNTAIAQCLDDGMDYIVFSDDDNTWKPFRLSAQLEFMEANPDCGMSWAVCEGFKDGRSIGLLRPEAPKHYDRQLLLSRPYIDSNEMMVRAKMFEHVGYFDERLKTLEDWDMSLRLGLQTKCLHLDVPLVNYALHDDNRVQKTMHLNGESCLAIGERERLAGPRYRVLFVRPPNWHGVVNHSHVQVMEYIENALERLPFVIHRSAMAEEPLQNIADDFRPNLIMYFYPVRMPHHTVNWLDQRPYPSMGLCVEDPYAHGINTKARPYFEWFVTNDAGCRDAYETPNGYTCVMPTLSADSVLHAPQLAGDTSKQADVVMVGAPYPKRIQALNNLMPITGESRRIVVIGEGWSAQCPVAFEAIERNISGEYAAWMSNSKVTLVVNRDNNDEKPPITPARGFIEGYAGACMAMETDREDLPRYFTEGKEFAGWHDKKSLLDTVKGLLDDPDKRQALRTAAHERAKQYTYEKRLTRLFMLTRGYRRGDEVL